MATEKTKYLIVGSSHAAMEAASAIRMSDVEGTIIMATRDRHPPYSPTVLPYVVSGKSRPDNIFLRTDSYFGQAGVSYWKEADLVKLDAKAGKARFADGREIIFEKALLATGAAPFVPPIPGLKESKFHVLRTLDDATGLKEAAGKAKKAVVLGGGLVGMHAAENLKKAGLAVTIVEMKNQVLPGYFDAKAASIISEAFSKNGIDLKLGRSGMAVDGKVLTLDDGSSIPYDLLLVAVGVKPDFGYLEGSGVTTAQGIVVDTKMRTSSANVWAAGDVAEAKGFLVEGTIVNGILPDAVEQGRIAGMDMAGDHGVKPYPGGVSINTYTFFGNQAISVGAAGFDPENAEIVRRGGAANDLKIVIKDNCLIGISAIGDALDAGIMWQMILRKVDLAPIKDAFLADPLTIGRSVMSKIWR
jgi:phenylglyoxylate dehydrogenase epsilon subunit